MIGHTFTNFSYNLDFHRATAFKARSRLQHTTFTNAVIPTKQSGHDRQCQADTKAKDASQLARSPPASRSRALFVLGPPSPLAVSPASFIRAVTPSALVVVLQLNLCTRNHGLRLGLMGRDFEILNLWATSENFCMKWRRVFMGRNLGAQSFRIIFPIRP